jgi:hypothetical protein
MYTLKVNARGQKLHEANMSLERGNYIYAVKKVLLIEAWGVKCDSVIRIRPDPDSSQLRLFLT